MNGRYLGEILYENRLMRNRNTPYRNNISGNYGNIGNYGNAGNIGSIGSVGGYEDINLEDLV